MAQYYTAITHHHNNNIVNMKVRYYLVNPSYISHLTVLLCQETDGVGYSLVGYSGPGYEVSEQSPCEAGGDQAESHYLHSVRLQHVSSVSRQEHRRPGK